MKSQLNLIMRMLSITLLFSHLAASAFAVDVGKWKRFEVSYLNSNWSGNPFDLNFRGTFTHIASGRQVTPLGFYASLISSSRNSK